MSRLGPSPDTVAVRAWKYFVDVTDRAIPNLPSRNLEQTLRFYESLGFCEVYRDASWMILRRGDLQLEFFAAGDRDLRDNWFSCCIRVSDLDALYLAFCDSGISVKGRGHPSLQPIVKQPWGQRMATLLDLDGVLLRLIEDQDEAKN